MKHIFILAAMLAGHSAVSLAQTERELESHEHGAAALNIAIEDSGVFLELETPWMNLVGFEHSPGTPEQHAQVDNALALLTQPEQLFLFAGSACTIVTSAVDSSLESGEHHEEDHDKDGHGEEGHAEKDHDADGHDEEGHAEKDHDEDGHAEKDHDEHGHDEEGESHSSVSAVYEYSCPDAAQLESVELSLLEVWPGIEELQVQLIGPGGQALAEMTPASTTLNLGQVQ